MRDGSSSPLPPRSIPEPGCGAALGPFVPAMLGPETMAVGDVARDRRPFGVIPFLVRLGRFHVMMPGAPEMLGGLLMMAGQCRIAH